MWNPICFFYVTLHDNQKRKQKRNEKNHSLGYRNNKFIPRILKIRNIFMNIVVIEDNNYNIELVKVSTFKEAVEYLSKQLLFILLKYIHIIKYETRKNNKNTYIRVKNGTIIVTTNYLVTRKSIDKLVIYKQEVL